MARSGWVADGVHMRERFVGEPAQVISRDENEQDGMDNCRPRATGIAASTLRESGVVRGSGGRFASLDAMRFLAAFSVLAYHFVSSYVPEELLDASGLAQLSAVTRYGYLGVNAFFLISGFVILASALPRTAVEFAIGRASRLYPSFWVAVLVTATAVTLLPAHAPPDSVEQMSVWVVVANLTMIPEMLGQPFVDGVYWTLQIELRFYFLVFAMLALGLQRRIEQCLWGWLLVLIAGEFVELPWLLSFLFIRGYGQYFILGCFVFLAVTRGWERRRIAAIVAASLMCILHALASREEFLSPDRTSAVVVPSVMLALIALLCLGTSRRFGATATSYAEAVGSITYPLYLTHAVLGFMVIGALTPELGVGPTLLVATSGAIGLATLLMRYVDVPARRPLARFLNGQLQSISMEIRKRGPWRGG